jgi:tRNA(Ser,Leu) C12 N-acetylase TAN1
MKYNQKLLDDIKRRTSLRRSRFDGQSKPVISRPASPSEIRANVAAAMERKEDIKSKAQERKARFKVATSEELVEQKADEIKKKASELANPASPSE